MLLLIGIIIAVALVAFTAEPLLATESSAGATLPIDVTPLADLKRRRLVLYENLKDLEFEFQSGKIASPDYQSLRENYLGEAAALMVVSQDAEQLKHTDTLIKRRGCRPARGTHSPPPRDYRCPHCGFENPVPVKFCGECGEKIARPS